MAKKLGLSRDEHSALGEELAAMRDRLVKITVQLSHSYPQVIADLAARAQADIDSLRSKLDDRVFQEFPGLGTKGNISVYYPERNRE